MNIEQEIRRLQDIMPASGRMFTKIISKPQQSKVICANFPFPWQQKNHHIYINFDYWKNLSVEQRDLLLLRSITLFFEVKWFKPDLYQGIILASLIGLSAEIIQTDFVGVVVAGSLTAISINQIWLKNCSPEKEIEADEKAIKIALRRGYTETQAARHLLEATENIAKIEQRKSLNFIDLVRCQKLMAIANSSF